MKKSVIRFFYIAAVFIMLGFGVYRWYQRPVRVDSGFRMVMGTTAHITAMGEDEAVTSDAISRAFKEINEIEELMSFHKEGSQLNMINRQAGEKAVKVDERVFEVIKKSIDYSRLSDGAFDITVAPIIEMWQEASSSGKRPDEATIETVKAKTGYQNLILEEDRLTVKFGVEGMKLDLGAIAKGYAIDRAVELLKANNCQSGLVDIGGDIRCFGTSPSNGAWIIGLQNPVSEGELITELRLFDHAVATSGDYRRFVFVEGKKYSHIMNPGAGVSAVGLASVSVIAETAMDADALATAVSVSGVQKGADMIRFLPNTEGIFIDSSGEISYTEGAKKVATRTPSRIIISKEEKESGEMFKNYEVKRTESEPKLRGDWGGPFWKEAEALVIDNYMGSEPEHKPLSKAKLLYDDDKLYVIFRVDDQYVKAVERGYQGMVCRDSCAEFFFTAGEDIEKGYFNLEMNCGGQALFHFQRKPREEEFRTPITKTDFERIKVYHSLPKIVDPEISEPLVWIIEYSIPFEVLDNYTEIIKPKPGVKWRANFFKCADDTSHPHWLTWSKVDLPAPDFHRPEFFGTLIFK